VVPDHLLQLFQARMSRLACRDVRWPPRLVVSEREGVFSSLVRRTDRRFAPGLETRVGNAAHVPELQEYLAAALVDCAHDLLPAFHLSSGVDARSPKVALPLLRNLSGLANDQAGGGALFVVLSVEVAWRIAFACPRARERRHHNTVVELDRTELVPVK